MATLLHVEVAVRQEGAGLASTALAGAARLLVHLPITVLIIAYAVRFGMLSISVYDGYASPGFDMGIPDQGLWLLSRFHDPFVTIMGRNWFGDHTSFIMVLAVPLYWIWPHAQALLALQACLLASAAIPIYLLGLRRTRSVLVSTVVAAAYLLNPALHWGNLEQFHVECFLVPAVAWAIYAAVEWQPVVLGVAVAATLLCKEDAALLMIPLGIWIFFRRNRTWGMWIVGVSAVWMALMFEVVIPALLGGGSVHTDRIPFGGLGGLVATVLVHPVKFWRYFRSEGRLFYLWQLSVSFGLAFAAGLDIAAVGILVLLANVLSNFGYMHMIEYHYSLPLVAVLAVATVVGVSRLPGASRYFATGVVLVSSVWACTIWGLAPFSHRQYPHPSPTSAYARAVNTVLRDVPPNAVVSAHYEFVAHLDHRTRVYQWPTPFSAQYWGLFKQEGQQLPFANQIQYVVLPVTLSGEDQAIWLSISKQFVPIDTSSAATVYKRVGS